MYFLMAPFCGTYFEKNVIIFLGGNGTTILSFSPFGINDVNFILRVNIFMAIGVWCSLFAQQAGSVVPLQREGSQEHHLPVYECLVAKAKCKVLKSHVCCSAVMRLLATTNLESRWLSLMFSGRSAV